jgi:tetratricopeptide (TPR) repeat protein
MTVTPATDRVIDLARELQAELRVQSNPQRRALAVLGLKPGSYGWTELPYASQAIEIWTDRLTRSPDDWRTRHHLAIAHHARAFDLEDSDDPQAADPDWRRALELWYGLWRDDAFWRDLASRLETTSADSVSALRERWPLDMLRVHLAIGLDETTKNYRRRAQIRLLLGSPFPATIADQVRMEGFEQVTAHMPAAAWDSSSYDPEAIRVGLQAVMRYIELDESFLPALKDLLRLLRKLQSAHVQAINSSDAKARVDGLRIIRALAGQYQPYVARLDDQLADIELDSLADLVGWHSLGGQAADLLGDYDAASACYQRAYRAGRVAGSEDAEQMRVAWLTATLQQARRLATGGRDEQNAAREVLAEIAVENEMPPSCLMLRANTCLLLDEFGRAQLDCEAGLAQIERIRTGTAAAKGELEYEASLRAIMSSISRVRRQRSNAPRVAAAIDAMAQERMADAIRLLTEAIAVDPEAAAAFCLRAKCHLAMMRPELASVDLARAQSLVGAGDADMTGTASQIASLEASVGAMQQRIRSYGGTTAFRMREQAMTEFRAQRFESAARVFRLALEAAEPDGGEELRAELRMCLEAQASQLFQPADALARAGDLEAARVTCDDALAIYADFFPALSLRARCHIEHGNVAAAIGDLDAAESSARRSGRDDRLESIARARSALARDIAGCGGALAYGKWQEAQRALRANDAERAVGLLREAIAAAGDEVPALREHLSLAISRLAVERLDRS